MKTSTFTHAHTAALNGLHPAIANDQALVNVEALIFAGMGWQDMGWDCEPVADGGGMGVHGSIAPQHVNTQGRAVQAGECRHSLKKPEVSKLQGSADVDEKKECIACKQRTPKDVAGHNSAPLLDGCALCFGAVGDTAVWLVLSPLGLTRPALALTITGALCVLCPCRPLLGRGGRLRSASTPIEAWAKNLFGDASENSHLGGVLTGDGALTYPVGYGLLGDID